MVFLDTHGDRTAWGFGTVFLELAWLAIGSLENLILMRLFVVPVEGRRPTQALTSCRASGDLGVPINLEPTGIKALLIFGLPFVIGSRGCDQIDAVLLATLHKLLGFGIIGCRSGALWAATPFASRLGGSQGSRPHPRCQPDSFLHG